MYGRQSFQPLTSSKITSYAVLSFPIKDSRHTAGKNEPVARSALFVTL